MHSPLLSCPAGRPGKEVSHIISDMQIGFGSFLNYRIRDLGYWEDGPGSCPASLRCLVNCVGFHMWLPEVESGAHLQNCLSEAYCGRKIRKLWVVIR
jgi:hypothetical protein